MKPPATFSLYDRPVDPGVDCSRETLKGQACQGADQSFAEDCDINVIMARAERSGQLPLPDGREPFYGDISGMPDDYLGARALVADAEDRFNALGPKVRARFGNDPYQLLVFASDEANRAEAEALGLVPAKPVVPEPKAKTGAEGAVAQ